MIDYLLLGVVCLLTGLRLIFNKLYADQYGAGLRSVYWFTALSCTVFVLCMLLVGTRPKATPFSLGVAAVFVVINLLCTYYGFAVIHVGNLSRYMLFLSLGGMVLPFLYGIFFNGDHLSVGRVLCLLLISAALLFGMDRSGQGSAKARFYYIMIFLLNGAACILLSLHQTNPAHLPAVGTAEFTVLYMTMLAGVGFLLVLALRLREGSATTPIRHGPDLLLSAGYGLFFGLGNYLTTLCLLHVEPFFQFPIVTGGSVVLSGLCGRLFGEKLGRAFLWSSVLVVLGTVAVLF